MKVSRFKHLMMESLHDFTSSQEFRRVQGGRGGEVFMVWINPEKGWRLEDEVLDRGKALEAQEGEVSDIRYDTLRDAVSQALAKEPAVISMTGGILCNGDFQRLASDKPELREYAEAGGIVMVGGVNVAKDILLNAE